jgi:hypothetical protein
MNHKALDPFSKQTNQDFVRVEQPSNLRFQISASEKFESALRECRNQTKFINLNESNTYECFLNVQTFL